MARIRLALLTAAITLTAACGGSDGTTTEPETPRATGISVTPTSVSFTFLGQTQSLSGRILDQHGATFQGSITWSSDDASIASVTAAGQVTAVAAGTTTIRATFQTLSSSVAVTVTQTPTRITIKSGDGQEAIAGAALAEPVVARVEDQGGSAVPGVTVTFTPGSGTVDPATAVTDADGEAATTWTLGEGLGPQTLTASADGGLSATVGATSLSPVPIPDLVTGGVLVLSRDDPTTLETITAQATIRNDGNASTGSGFKVRVVFGATELASQNLPALEPDASTTVTFTVGPFSAGSKTLRLEVDSDEAIEELDETNNTLQASITVVTQTVVQPGQTLTGLSAADTVELLYRVDLAAPATNLTIETSGGSGDLDLYVEGGVRPSHRDDYDDCVSGNSTSDERCQVSALSETTFHILAFAWDEFSGVTMEISVDGEVVPYDIELVFIDHGTASQDAAFETAAARMTQIVTTDVPDISFQNQNVDADACIEGQPAIGDDETVDDIRIYVKIGEIDGPGQTLARAGPCIFRGLSRLPLVGTMEFDAADLEQLETDGHMADVVMHEMLHVIGVGTLWGPNFKDLLRNPSVPNSAGADTHFAGELAVAAFDDAGGTNYTGGQKVPVENTADEGSADAHWRESAMRRELMTPFLNNGVTNALSAVTVQSLADVGYIVDPSKADAYTQAFSAASLRDASDGPVIDLSNDIRSGPMYEVDDKGRVTRRR